MQISKSHSSCSSHQILPLHIKNRVRKLKLKLSDTATVKKRGIKRTVTNKDRHEEKNDLKVLAEKHIITKKKKIKTK